MSKCNRLDKIILLFEWELMLLKAANTLNYRVLTVGVLLIYIANFSSMQFPCNMLTIIHFTLALKYLLNFTVEKLWGKTDKENK